MKARLLPLNKDLEHAAIRACLDGQLALDQISIEELSKPGRAVYKALVGLGGKKPSIRGVTLAAVELHGGDTADVRDYLKSVQANDIGADEIGELLDTLARKRAINEMVNEASDQIASGEYSLLALKEIADKVAHSRNKLTPLSHDMTGKVAPPVGILIPSLPSINKELNGLYGVWIMQGEPAAGKSTLALQVSLSATQDRPVLYYDFEQGADVIKWHVHEAFQGNKAKIQQYTSRFYVRSSLNTLERDLGALNCPALIVVDSIQKVSRSISHRRETIESVIHRLESLKKYGHHTIMVSEKNRASYGTPTMGGGKETGELEYAGDAAFDLLKVDEQRTELWVTKNRHYPFTGLLAVLERENNWRFRELGGSSTRRSID